MNATIIARTPTSFTLQVEIPYNDSMLDFEEALQERLNDAGVVATAEGLQQFDTDGSPITVGPVKFTTKGQVEKDYQTPYGVATVARHVYQSPAGRPDLLPARPGRPDRRHFHPPVRQDHLAQVRRVQLAPGPGRPGGESRPGGLPLPDPGRRRCGGGGGDGQGGGLELRPAEVRGAARHGRRQPGRDLHADVRGRLAGGDGRHPGLLRRRGRAAAHGLPGGDPGVRQGEVPGPPGGGDRACQGEVPRRPLRGDRRRGRVGTGSSWGGTPTCR